MRQLSLLSFLVWLFAACHCQAEALHQHQTQHPQHSHKSGQHQHHEHGSEHRQNKAEQCELRLLYVKQLALSADQENLDSSSADDDFPTHFVSFVSSAADRPTISSTANNPRTTWYKLRLQSVGGPNAPPTRTMI